VSLQTLRIGFERLLEMIVVVLMVAMTTIVVAGAAFRYLGHSLVWYDETASIALVWLTYYGSALAALKGMHIGVPALINALPPRARVATVIFAEACVFGFFSVLAVTGFQVLGVLVGDYMVSLPRVPLWFTQSAVPIGAVLFIIAEALRLPQVIAEARGAGLVDAEFREIMETAAPLAETGAPERRP
jgi:TRAP-type C4-dicarboxylate transport system permease small subunit